MHQLKVLILAQSATPDAICGALIAYSQAQALGCLHDVTLVIGAPSERSVRSKQGALRSVEVVRLRWIDQAFAWCLERIFKNNYHNQLLQVFIRAYSVLFELQAWRQLRTRIKKGEFDVVLRLLPISTITLSPFAFFVRNSPIPLIVGPLNGGLPWLSGFRQATIQNKWINRLRYFYPLLPLGRSTYNRAAAIIAGSSHTFRELSAHHEKLFFLPENGINSAICFPEARSGRQSGKLELIFIGALIPLKACDLALRGAASLLKSDLAHFTIVGDGPERRRLEEMTQSLQIEDAVSFLGMLPHDEAMRTLRAADVLVFPSIRDFGGGVVFEALGEGIVPVVADFGGPGDTVNPEVGYRVSLTNETEVTLQIEEILGRLVSDRDHLERIRQNGIAYAQQYLTWEAKALTITSIIYWTLGHGVKPNLPPPKPVCNRTRASDESVLRAN